MKSRFFIRIIAVIFISLAIGLIYIYPDLRFIFELKDEFKGITLTATNDELGYLARIKAVYKGNLTCKGIDLYEHKNALWTYPFLSELIEGSIGRVLNIEVVWLDILMSFFLPVILFWLIFVLLTKLSNSPACSFFGAASILLGYSLFTGTLRILKEIFILRSFAQPLWFLRPISPQLNHIIFIFSLLMIYISITKKRLFYTLVSAIFVGCLFYIHPHYWTFIYAGLAVLVLSFLIVNNKEALRITLSLITLSLLTSFPFWIHAYKVRLNPNYSNAMSFSGLIYTHNLNLPVFHVLSTIVIIVTLWYLKDPNLVFFASFLIGGILCLNQQLITGVTLVPGHWKGYTNKTFIMIALVVAFFKVIKKIQWDYGIFASRTLKVCLFLSAFLFLYASSFIQQNNYYKTYKANVHNRQSIAGVYRWLNHNAKNIDVVLTDPYNYPLNSIPEVLTYTNCYTYLPMAYTSLISKEENEERLLYAFRFFRHSLQEVESYFTYANGAYFAGVRVVPEYGGESLLTAEIERLKDKYVRLYPIDIIEVIKKYKVDYAVIDKNNLSKYDTQIYKDRLKIVYEDKEFVILKIII